jgi:hypothetical protein
MMKNLPLSFALATLCLSLIGDVAPWTALDEGTGVRIIEPPELPGALGVSPNSTCRF